MFSVALLVHDTVLLKVLMMKGWIKSIFLIAKHSEYVLGFGHYRLKMCPFKYQFLTAAHFSLAGFKKSLQK